MPGKRGNNWQYITPATLYRVVDAAVSDVHSAAGIIAIEEVIDRTAVDAAYNSVFNVAAVSAVGVTSYDIAVYVDITPETENGRWCLAYLEENVEESILTTVPDVPPGRIKVAVFNIVGIGGVSLFTQHSL